MESGPLIAPEAEVQVYRHGDTGVDDDGGKPPQVPSKADSISGDESSPLLGTGENDIDDFEGLPWYRKPSVRYPFCTVSRAED